MRKTSSDLTMMTFRLDSYLLAGLQTVKERDGVTITEQVRRAVRAWLEDKGIRQFARKQARKVRT